jgi:hypothetical protein
MIKTLAKYSYSKNIVVLRCISRQIYKEMVQYIQRSATLKTKFQDNFKAVVTV